MRTPVNRALRWQAALVAGVMGMAAVGVSQAQGRSPTPTMRLVSETPYPAPATGVRLAPLSAQELRDVAIDAYIYAYPMVLMEVTRRQTTNVQSPVAGRAPIEPVRPPHLPARCAHGGRGLAQHRYALLQPLV